MYLLSATIGYATYGNETVSPILGNLPSGNLITLKQRNIKVTWNLDCDYSCIISLSCSFNNILIRHGENT